MYDTMFYFTASETETIYIYELKRYLFANDTNLEVSSIVCGVPQGSKLGPHIFLFYVNDIAFFRQKL